MECERTRHPFTRLAAAALALAMALPAVPVLADPPPHAPAHGYRHKQYQGHDLVFDAGLGVYVVADLRDHYYHDGRFFRWAEDGWMVSSRLDGDWEHRPEGHVPRALIEKHRPAKGKRKHRRNH